MTKFFYTSLFAAAMVCAPLGAVDSQVANVAPVIDQAEMVQMMQDMQSMMFDRFENALFNFYVKFLSEIEDFEKNYCLDEAGNKAKLDAIWADFMDNNLDDLISAMKEALEKTYKDKFPKKTMELMLAQLDEATSVLLKQTGAENFARGMRIRSMAYQQVHGNK